jgi:signal recognition particle subunit SRP14
MLLENDNFLLELTKLFQQQRVKNSGSLSLTMKRHDGRTKPKAQLTKKQRLEQKKSSTPTTSNLSTTHESVEYKCLVRATYGSKKLSTIVSSKDINRFQLAYSNLLKANMDTLKKKAKESKTTKENTNNTGEKEIEIKEFNFMLLFHFIVVLKS